MPNNTFGDTVCSYQFNAGIAGNILQNLKILNLNFSEIWKIHFDD